MSHNFMLAVALKDSDKMDGEIVGMPNEGYISRGYAFEFLSLLVEKFPVTYLNWEFISFTESQNKASIALLENWTIHICVTQKNWILKFMESGQKRYRKSSHQFDIFGFFEQSDIQKYS